MQQDATRADNLAELLAGLSTSAIRRNTFDARTPSIPRPWVVVKISQRFGNGIYSTAHCFPRVMPDRKHSGMLYTVFNHIFFRPAELRAPGEKLVYRRSRLWRRRALDKTIHKLQARWLGHES